MQPWKWIKKSPLVHFFLFLLLLWVGYRAFGMVRQAVRIQEDADETKQKIGELTRKKKELEAYLVELKEREAIEREAKARFNLKKPGEAVVVVVPKEYNDQVSSSTVPFWKRIKIFFQALNPF